ncbi:MAG: succinylglutamate desuccinylase/aspartoacylase family protein [Flavobacteriales bacterium]|nr:MAG: succinylglutamate desuccinylase/aspartoacylase family protein [Flavobacteriales bacterium]
MPNKTIEILGTPIKPGKSYRLTLNIAKLHTRSNIEIPIIVSRGKVDGPSILLTGGIHGNEINGVEIVRSIIIGKYHKPSKGMVICIPVVNVFGFINQTRQFPDGRDLNRVFPGNNRGSLASRFAYYIMKEIIPHIDYGIDYHTGGNARFNIAQIRMDPKNKECLQLARIFGAPFILESKNKENTFRDVCVKKGKTILLFEGGKSMFSDDQITAYGVAGALRVMHHLGVRDFQKELSDVKYLQKESILLESSRWVRATYSGMYRPNVGLGAYVEKGEVIASISDPFGDFEKFIKARSPGYVICVNHSPIVNQGDAILHISQKASKR